MSMNTRRVNAVIQVHNDYESNPEDSDCYDAVQINAWHNDQWHYVGIVPVVELTDGYALVTIEGPSLWGIDYGCPATDAEGREQPYDHDAFLRECAADQWGEIPQDIAVACGDIDWSAAQIKFSA